MFIEYCKGRHTIRARPINGKDCGLVSLGSSPRAFRAESKATRPPERLALSPPLIYMWRSAAQRSADTKQQHGSTLRHRIHGGDTNHRTPPMASATASSCSLLRLPRPSSFPLSHRRDTTSASRRQTLFPAVASVAKPREVEIVIVGAGIAGLATALSLHRLGIRSVVLEQGDSLRAGGTSLTLFKNGWRALDSIGVADELRGQFLQIQGPLQDGDESR